MVDDLLKKNGELLKLIEDEKVNNDLFKFKVTKEGLKHSIGHDILEFADDIMTHTRVGGAVAPSGDITLSALDIGKIRDALEKLSVIGEMLRNIDSRGYCPVEGYGSENSVKCPTCGEAAIDIRNRGGSRDGITLADMLDGKSDAAGQYKMFACHKCQGFGERKVKGGPVTEVKIEEPLSDKELKRRAELADDLNNAMFGEKR